MDKEFIPYQQALELKELGFDEECLNKYIRASQKLNSDMDTSGKYYPKSFTIPAPLYQQAFRWFRENHGYNCFIPSTLNGKYYYFRENLNDRQKNLDSELTDKFEKYEEAELACLKKLIEIVKNK